MSSVGEVIFTITGYNLGKESQRLYSHKYPGDRHDEEAIEKMLIRIMLTVLNWEAE